MRISDWSSDVCSSDLDAVAVAAVEIVRFELQRRDRRRLVGDRNIPVGGALRLKVGVAASEVENRVAGDRPCATKRGSRQEDRLIALVALVEGGRIERLTPTPQIGRAHV